MKAIEILPEALLGPKELKQQSYKPKAIAIHYGGFNGNKIPDDLKKFIQKHVKTNAKGQNFISQYPDRWYYNAFTATPNITDWDSFYDVIKPYWTTQRVWHPQR